MTRHTRRFTALVDDPTPQEVAAHRAVGKEISGRIVAAEAALAALPTVTVTAADLKVLHAQLTRTDVGTLAQTMAAADDSIGLRDLVTAVVAKAVVTDRVPARRSWWLRVEVTWTPDIQLLLDAGLLTLAPHVARPYYPDTPQEQARERCRRSRARKKAGLV
jgi:hypothetical protein